MNSAGTSTCREAPWENKRVINKNNKEQIEQIQDRSFVPHVRAESSWNVLQKGFAIPGSA